MTNKITSRSVISTGEMKMPIIGLGTWQSSEEEIETAINVALETGYRHIDTAFVYGNEKAIGKTLEKWFKSGKIERKDLFIVTKLPPVGNRPEHVEFFLKKSLEALKIDYVDLYLIHHPVGLKYYGDDNLLPQTEKGLIDADYETDHVAIWKAMESQVDAGRTRAIGLSNFNIKQIDRIVKSARIPPANVQVEMHIYLPQFDLQEYCRDHNITLCAYAPLGSPALTQFIQKVGFKTDEVPSLSPMTDPVVSEIAQTHKKTPAQVLLRYLMQLGMAIIPKSTNPERIKQNFQVFDFQLSTEEMDKMKRLDRKESGRMFIIGIFRGAEDHPEFPVKLTMNKL